MIRYTFTPLYSTFDIGAAMSIFFSSLAMVLVCFDLIGSTAGTVYYIANTTNACGNTNGISRNYTMHTNLVVFTDAESMAVHVVWRHCVYLYRAPSEDSLGEVPSHAGPTHQEGGY